MRVGPVLQYSLQASIPPNRQAARTSCSPKLSWLVREGFPGINLVTSLFPEALKEGLGSGDSGFDQPVGRDRSIPVKAVL